MDTQIQYPSFFRRLSADFIYKLIWVLPPLLFGFLDLVINLHNGFEEIERKTALSDDIKKLAFFLVLWFLSYLAFTLFFRIAYSATPCELLLKLKITDSKTSKIPTLWQFVKRLLAEEFILIFGILGLAYCLINDADYMKSGIIYSITMTLHKILLITDFGLFTCTKQKQMLCDIIAGTVVVKR
jgi:hypothetical protein